MDIQSELKLIMENIEGMMVIDINANIVYMADHLAKQAGFPDGDAIIGQNIRDIIPTNTAYKALETGKKKIGEVYFVEGKTVVSNTIPLFKNGTLIGALEYDVFENAQMLHNFLDKIGELANELSYYKQEVRQIRGAKYSIENIIGESESTRRLREQIRTAAHSSSTVLVQGETGCGKELVAHSIHGLSTRGLTNFVKVNCSAIPSELIESELFGYEGGTFTGAIKGGKKGKVELANGGTLFLDEVNQLPLHAQPKLLRFLQEKEIYRIGGDYAVPIDVRVIAASNEDLKQLVKEGKFRKDLYYRLNVLRLNVQPLRKRKEDIPLISRSVIDNLNITMGRVTNPITSIDDDVLKLLAESDWPGNVRELQNILERAMNNTHSTGSILEVSDFGTFFHDNEKGKIVNNLKQQSSFTLKEIKQMAEKMAIERALEFCDGNKSQAAELLGISRQMLHRKISEV